jgi:predicted Zn-dependent peptidase
VKGFTRQELFDYRKAQYVPDKTLVVVAGNIDEAEVVRDVTAMFGTIEKASVLDMEKVTENQTAPEVKIYDKQTDQTHFVLGFRTFNKHDKRRRTLGVLSTILGHGMSSRLFHRIREELGLCYSIGTSVSLEPDCGVFMIRAGVAHDKIEQTVKESLIIMKDICDNGVTEQELQKAKDFKIGNMYLSLETSDSLADWYGFQELDKDDILSPEDLESEIRAVTKEDVQSVAKVVYNLAQANLAVIGPHKGKEGAWKDLLC